MYSLLPCFLPCAENRSNLKIHLTTWLFLVFACSAGAQGIKDTLLPATDSAFADSVILPNAGSKVIYTSLADSIISYANSFSGKRYRRGGTGAKGFDCSGFTMIVYRKFGIKLPHTSAGQALVGYEVSLRNARKGDLILFRGRNMRSKRIGHVGIIITSKGEPIQFIHSSSSDGVRIDKADYPYYKKRYMKIVRIL